MNNLRKLVELQAFSSGNAYRQRVVTIFRYDVEDQKWFGIMEFDKVSDDKEYGMQVLFVEVKPADPKSNYTIVGLYFYLAGVSEITVLIEVLNICRVLATISFTYRLRGTPE